MGTPLSRSRPGRGWLFLVAAAGAAGCAAPVPESFQPVAVQAVRLSAPLTPVQVDHVAILYSAPKRAHRALARLHARGRPGLHIAYVYGELREEAAALGADALVIREAREEVRPPPSVPLLTGRPATVIGGVLYDVEATAIEYVRGEGKGSQSR